MRKLGFMFALLFFGVVACESDLGEECSEEGTVDGECDDGLVCGKKSATDTSLACLKQCTNPADCGSHEECSSVGNTSLRGCRAIR